MKNKRTLFIEKLYIKSIKTSGNFLEWYISRFCFTQQTNEFLFFNKICPQKKIKEAHGIIEFFETDYMKILDNELNVNFYDPKFWSYNEKVPTYLERTTNGAKSWHRTLNLRAEIVHQT